MTKNQKTRVLVVEDEAVIGALLQDVLEDSGYDVVLKTTGGEALAAQTEGPCDLAIVDYGLPDCNGLEVAQRLGPAPSGNRPGVILATGWGLLEESQLAGVVDQLLSKPFNMGELIMQLERLSAQA